MHRRGDVVRGGESSKWNRLRLLGKDLLRINPPRARLAFEDVVEHCRVDEPWADGVDSNAVLGELRGRDAVGATFGLRGTERERGKASMKWFSVILIAGLMCMGIASPAEAASKYKNCTAYNKVYPHGVGKKHAHDHTTGTPVTTFKHSTKLYNRAMSHNSGLDRDKDNVACEKK